MNLPLIQTTIRELSMMESQWKARLDPILSIPMLSGVQLTSVALVSGTNTINHRLDRIQQGWIITDEQSAATIYRSAPFNDKTLTLTASAPVIVSLWVY